MIDIELEDYSDAVEAEFQRKLVEEYGKMVQVGPFREELLAMLLAYHGEWYEMALTCYKRELVASGEYIEGRHSELWLREDMVCQEK